MIIQISLVQTNLPFCNQKTESTQWVSDTIGRNFEVVLFLHYDDDDGGGGGEDNDNDNGGGRYFAFFSLK